MSEIKRVAILFSGGPAPAANAVISTAAVSFLRHNIEVVGILYGYSALVEYEAGSRELAEGTDYIKIDHTVPFRVSYIISENGGAVFPTSCSLQ